MKGFVNPSVVYEHSEPGILMNIAGSNLGKSGPPRISETMFISFSFLLKINRGKLIILSACRSRISERLWRLITDWPFHWTGSGRWLLERTKIFPPHVPSAAAYKEQHLTQEDEAIIRVCNCFRSIDPDSRSPRSSISRDRVTQPVFTLVFHGSCLEAFLTRNTSKTDKSRRWRSLNDVFRMSQN